MSWLWPLRIPPRLAEGAWRFAGCAERLFEGWGWAPAAAAAGTVPLALAFWTGGAWHQVVSALALFALFLAAVRADRMGHGLAAIAVAYASHMLLAIGLSSAWPAAAAACFPGGESYWAKNLTWLQTGADPEYELSNWVPAHFQLFGAMVLFSYLSFGLIPFLQGFREVDLMNFYVGRLLSQSSSETVALGMGWHAWSLMRGLCYMVLVYEVASWSLSRLTGRELSTRRGRCARWSAALVFFALDCGLKFYMLEPVRTRLAGNLF